MIVVLIDFSVNKIWASTTTNFIGMDKSTQIQTKGKTRQTKGVFFFFLE